MTTRPPNRDRDERDEDAGAEEDPMTMRPQSSPQILERTVVGPRPPDSQTARPPSTSAFGIPSSFGPDDEEEHASDTEATTPPPPHANVQVHATEPPPTRFAHGTQEASSRSDPYGGDEEHTAAFLRSPVAPATRAYAVVHDTIYTYEHPVSLSRQIVHLAPRPLSYQTCRSHVLKVTPEPEILATTEDAFGNPITSLFIEPEHTSLKVQAETWVDITAREYPADDDTPPWEEVRGRLAYRAGRPPHPADLEASRFLFESARVRNKRELAQWTLACFPPRVPILAGVRSLMNRIHEELTFDPKATTVSTPVMAVFELKRGVCQDFAHLMLSCLRSIGLAARYVSGYLLTHPPPGRQRLVGADASHAWISVYVPDDAGGVWVDADPTNGVFPSLEHVTLGWGRDYDDVIPLRGVLLGGGDHELDIAVTVAPEADYESVFGATRSPPAAV
ncbi:MAG: transglutaminase family protein [Labilithrix sp.]|nr:transglutaminase family protein [Labilithrix sp.]MCW5815831.1 transglutaminase family protein [Labilithrix sp.]